MTFRLPRLLSVLPALALVAATQAADAPSLDIARWNDGELQRWKVEEFAGRTQYRIESSGDKRWLRAEASGTASGLFLEQSVDLAKTPYLTWHWRIAKPLRGLDERTKGGDDYSARLYVVVSGGAFFWRTRALNYVWSGSQPAGATWANAYTENAQMVAVRGEGDSTGEWVMERRNVLEDLRKAFGEEIDRIDAIAIMTDADNSSGNAAADYGIIRFSAD